MAPENWDTAVARAAAALANAARDPAVMAKIAEIISEPLPTPKEQRRQRLLEAEMKAEKELRLLAKERGK